MTGTVMIAADQVSNLFDLHAMHIIPMPDSVLFLNVNSMPVPTWILSPHGI